MNLKKILAGVVAAALAVTTMSFASFAEGENEATVTESADTETTAEEDTETTAEEDTETTTTEVTGSVKLSFEDSDFDSSVDNGYKWKDTGVSLTDLIGELDSEDVSSIVFTGASSFTVGYNSNEVTNEETGSTWKQFDAEAAEDGTYTLTVSADDIDFGNSYYLMIGLSVNVAGDYTVAWTTATAAADDDDDTTTDITYGDVNGDGEINSWDAVLIARLIAGGWDISESVAADYDYETAADVDGSGAVNIWDITVIMRYLTKWADYQVLGPSAPQDPDAEEEDDTTGTEEGNGDDDEDDTTGTEEGNGDDDDDSSENAGGGITATVTDEDVNNESYGKWLMIITDANNFLGEYDADDVTYVTFYSDYGVTIYYNTNEVDEDGDSVCNEVVISDSGETLEDGTYAYSVDANGINLGDCFYLAVGYWATEAGDYTLLTWTIAATSSEAE